MENKKQVYEEPQMEIVSLEETDVITTSGGTTSGGDSEFDRVYD